MTTIVETATPKATAGKMTTTEETATATKQTCAIKTTTNIY